MILVMQFHEHSNQQEINEIINFLKKKVEKELLKGLVMKFKKS